MREATICKVEGDDVYYHLEPEPGHIMSNDDPRFIAMSGERTTYCGKKIVSVPHEWINVPYGINSKMRIDFTWGHLKPCPICEKNRREDEQSAWGF